MMLRVVSMCLPLFRGGLVRIDARVCVSLLLNAGILLVWWVGCCFREIDLLVGILVFRYMYWMCLF